MYLFINERILIMTTVKLSLVKKSTTAGRAPTILWMMSAFTLCSLGQKNNKTLGWNTVKCVILYHRHPFFLYVCV